MSEYYCMHPYAKKLDECEFLIKNNNLEELKNKVIYIEPYVYTLIDFSVKCGKLDIFKYLLTYVEINSYGYFFNRAIELNQSDIYNWIVSIGYQLSDTKFRDAVANFEFDKVAIYLKLGFTFNYHGISEEIKKIPVDAELLIRDYNLRYNRGAAAKAAIAGNSKLLFWLLNNGFKIKTDPGIPKGLKNRDEILRIFHERRIPGNYRGTCKSGNCKLCRIVNIWDLWDMENAEYTNYAQWLHRELVENLEEYLLSEYY